jgi:alpha-galactosidase
VGITRRDVLRMAASVPLAATIRHPRVGAVAPLDRAALERASWRIVAEPADARLRVERSWDGSICRSRLVNAGARAARVAEVVLFDLAHGLPPETRFYGEGFQMLSQTGGTLGVPLDLGNYTDPKHYKLPEPAGARAVYGLATFAAPAGPHHAVAFTSCRRFSGKFYVSAESLQAVLDAEAQVLQAGDSWDLEEFCYTSGDDRAAILDALGMRLAANHPPLKTAAPPAGWCSWYCFGPRVTAAQVLANLGVIAREIPGLKYIQIDDGYQPAMGDWLETGAAFEGNLQAVLTEIRKRGFEPALWVAPFIAEAGSRLFRDHPEWFVKDGEGAPLRSDKVSFGGWRRGPWYVLDGTHPDAQAHLAEVFRTMRENWGCTYFKLDANFWGAIQGGRFHDPAATRIEAYRRGMDAIRRGAGDAFILGCNHPIWPSLGLVHGSRSSNDIKREWKRVADTARQNLMRNWQNGRLWWNDPDAVVLTGALAENEFRYHATAIYASGGMILSGDDLTSIPPDRLAMLGKLEPPTGVAARFDDADLRVGRFDRTEGAIACLLNESDTLERLTFTLRRRAKLMDLWTDEVFGVHDAGPVALTVPARTGRVVIALPV